MNEQVAGRYHKVIDNKVIAPMTMASLEASGSVGARPSASDKRSNFIARHWRGELSLPVAYWIVGLLTNALVAISVAVVIAWTSSTTYEPIRIFATVLVVWSIASLAITWQLVGVWRAATAYIANRKNGSWGYLAKLAIVLGAFRFAAEFCSVAAPQIGETWRMAFNNDAELPNYTLRLLNNGTELGVQGGIKYGLSADVTKLLNAAPTARIIHLDSAGGRIKEAEQLFDLIQSRGLSTYVSQVCASACTIAFAAGRQRLIAPTARLGFHSAAFPGVSDADARALNDDDRLRRVGISPDFIRKGNNTSSTSMWWPSQEELQSSKMITGVVDPHSMASSDLKLVTRDNIIRDLKKIPLYSALADRSEVHFLEVVDRMKSGLDAGRPMEQIQASVRAIVVPYIRSQYAHADDATLMSLGKLVLQQTMSLKSDPPLCYSFSSGKSLGRDVVASIPKHLTDQEIALDVQILRTAGDRQNLPKQDQDRLFGLVGAKLAKTFGTKTGILTKDDVPVAEYSAYCDLSIATYREILALTPIESVGLLRAIYTQ